VETTLGLTLNPSTLEPAIVSRYKERIEFEYDLIVAIAKDNASAGHLAVEENLTQKLGLSSKIQIETDLAFTKSNEVDRPKQHQFLCFIILVLHIWALASTLNYF
jgi:hypothetical protein